MESCNDWVPGVVVILFCCQNWVLVTLGTVLKKVVTFCENSSNWIHKISKYILYFNKKFTFKKKVKNTMDRMRYSTPAELGKCHTVFLHFQANHNATRLALTITERIPFISLPGGRVKGL